MKVSGEIYGPAINLSPEYFSGLLELSRRPDPMPISWVEVMADHFVSAKAERLDELSEISRRLPMAMHGVSLSIGGTDPLDLQYLDGINRIAKRINAAWFSDHLAFSSFEGVPFFDLLPLPQSHEVVRHVVQRIKEVQARLQIPFALENPSRYIDFAENEISESQFVSEILEQSDCLFLLDINNVYVNAYNSCIRDRVDPHEAFSRAVAFLDQVPLDRVIEVHTAGYHQHTVEGRSLIIDTHGGSVSVEVLKLTDELRARIPIERLMLERESNFPALSDICGEALEIWRKVSGEVDTTKTASAL